MEIDTGVDANQPIIQQHLDQSDKEANPHSYIDEHGHGTHIAGIILKDVCPQVKFYSCNYYEKDNKQPIVKTNQCYERAIKLGINIINYSSSGTDPSLVEFDTIKKLVENRIIFITAAGNHRKPIIKLKKSAIGYLITNRNCDIWAYRASHIKQCLANDKEEEASIWDTEALLTDEFPAGYDIPGTIAVGNVCDEFHSYQGNSCTSSNYGPAIVYEVGDKVESILPNDYIGTMSGTSQAAAVHTNKLLKALCQ